MTDKRDRASTEPCEDPGEQGDVYGGARAGLGLTEPSAPSTLRSIEGVSIEGAVDAASIIPKAPEYYEPAPLVPVSDHRTLELETVRLSEDIDPRKFVTELRLGRVPVVLAPDSGRSPQTALSSSQPPTGPTRPRRTPAVLLALLGALLLLVLARAATRPSGATAEPVSTNQAATGNLPVGAATPPTAAPASLPALAQAPAPGASLPALAQAPAPTLAAGASLPALATSAAVAPPVSREPTANAAVHVNARPTRTHSAKSTPGVPSPSARPGAPLVAPSSSKPKRAIY